jgi:hypothetical protein
MTANAALKASELNIGDTYSECLVEDLKRTQIVQYAGASGDYNPLHTDEVFTTKVAGYPTVFAHGMLTMGMTGSMLTNYVGDGRLTKYGVRFDGDCYSGVAGGQHRPVRGGNQESGWHHGALRLRGSPGGLRRVALPGLTAGHRGNAGPGVEGLPGSAMAQESPA